MLLVKSLLIMIGERKTKKKTTNNFQFASWSMISNEEVKVMFIKRICAFIGHNPFKH